MHHQGAGLGQRQLVAVEAVIAEILLHRGHEGAVHPLALEAQHHHDVAAFQPRAHVGEHLDPEALDAGGQQRRGADHPHPGAQRLKQDDVRARHPRMQDVAADRDLKPLDAALVAADGERVEQRLGRVFVGAVAGIDHGAIDLAGEQMHRACRVVAHHDDVGPHGVERRGGVDQRLALLHRGRGDRHVHHVGAEPLAREFERGLRAGRGLEEQVDLRAAPQDGALLLDLSRQGDGGVGALQERFDVRPAQAFDAEQVPVREGGCGLSGHAAVLASAPRYRCPGGTRQGAGASGWLARPAPRGKMVSPGRG